MKEMLGGCSVCCDDTGWTENPLVYCDGPNCNVAVHQACYGIRIVPKGEWFCRKCEAFKEKSIKVKCELCPSKDGALKPTENGNWAHVVCALYIPEVTFMDVTTMEPVKLSAIPRDRFNRLCYICEEKNKGQKVTVSGACMSCNKSGCKLGFHVTCAQSAGLLCEEAGNYYDNVKYVGYCKHHYSKLKKSNNIKPIAPYRPQNQSDNSSSDITPEKQSPQNIDNITDSQTSKPKRKLTIINNFGDKIASEKKVKDSTIRNAQSEDLRVSGPHIVTTHPSGNLVISIGTKVENRPASKKNYSEDPETEIKHSAKYQKTKNTMNIPKSEEDQSSNGLKVTEEPNLYRVENKSTIIKSSGSAVNLTQIPESSTLKKETSVINSPSSHNKQVTKTEATEKKITNAAAPHMLGNSLNPSSSMAQKMADTLNEEIETHKMFNNESNLSSNVPKNVMLGPQLQRRNQRASQIVPQETSQPQGSASSWSSFSNGINNNSPQALEDLLERQWEQGGAFLMEQAQHFDIASLLTCLYQLKSENVNLEDELASYTRRRDHLLAVNARLAIPLTPQNNRNRAPAPPTNNHTEAPIPIQPPRSNYQPNHGNIDPSLQHRYQNHISHRHPANHLSNNIPSNVVIRGGVVQEPRSDNRRQVNHNMGGVLNSNPMYQAAPQQPSNMALPRHQMGMDGHPKHS
ncbi:protein AF-10 [Acyrthosiphon pisum]|uniref:Protein AF-10 n=1 Tax=Acyrthosiphon pisum TaxID=7029 RepID=A0A8R1W5F1_ACYPI|nr:protein AF-10 [Acyrthosiphon pisum]XP_008182663.1 protein AF-10 [Acyrthosiphon pisum]|eukprot:XP_003244249.1 PREDICTED: protein AF-10 [Acyrthosiphon pisum]